MKRDNIFVKDKKFFKSTNVNISPGIRGLRGRIIIITIIFLVIIIIYQTYFESTRQEDITDKDEDLTFSHSSSLTLDNIIINDSTRLLHPTITMDKNKNYLIAFETVLENGTSAILFTKSEDGRIWTGVWSLTEKFINARNPNLNYANNEYILSYNLHGELHYRSSPDGLNWQTTSIEISDFFANNDSIYFGKDYILLVNKTGLWFNDYDEIEHIINMTGSKLLFDCQFLNGSILKISDYQFIIVHENTTQPHNSLTLLIITLKEPEHTSSIIKWDLLIIFVILGAILLTMIIQEIARD